MSSIKPQHRHNFRPKLIALSVAACFSLSSTQTQANPTGGSVASGSATFAVSGNTLTITNSAGAIINWANFSIGVNEITQFLQSSGASAVLNRVVGANGVIPQSVIDGILSSNGRVFLLNPSGVMIGSTARIDVAGFVASSLNLSDEDFRNGRLNFTQTPGAGAVSNAGVIDTSSGGPGGRVFLIAPDVQNSGIIRSPQGEIVLAAGKSVELVSEGSPFVTVNITADSERAVNLGQLISESGHIGMFGALVRQGGVIDANSAVAGPNGEIRLVATHDLTLDAGSRTTANGASGGNVLLQAQGGTNLVYGTVEAKGSSGQGGTIQALGVRVGILGSGVIDASGDSGGGTVLIGGDRHGDNPNVQNAEQVLIGPDGVIRADAGTTGDGGRVIVWSDAETRAFGSISAQGGSQSGNGGFVETSSRGGMDLTGLRVDTRAANGQWGTWLLDPDNVIFEPNSYVAGDPLAYAATFTTNPGTTAHITAQTVEQAFATNGSVQVQATNDVDFRTDLTLLFGTPGGLFEVRAQNNIDMAYGGTGAHTIFTNGQNVTLSANDIGVGAAGGPALNTASGTGSIIGGGNIVASYGGGVGGNITLSGYGVNVGTLQTAGGFNTRLQTVTGNVTITALSGGVRTGNITTHGVDGLDFDPAKQTAPTAGGNGGNVILSVANGAIVTGNIDASGGRGGNGGAVNGVVFAGQAGGNGGNIITSGVPIGQVTLSPGSITTGTIAATGGRGGDGSNNDPAATGIASGGAGGNGGVVSFGNITGAVSVGAIEASGGNGGNGADANGLGLAGAGGNGGLGGIVTLASTVGDVSAQGIVARGGNGAYGGATSALAGLGGLGGNGGQGGSVSILAPVSATAGTIDASGGAGGAGGAASAGYGGNGGAGGSNSVASVLVEPGSGSVGSIIAAGGAGGSGGNGGILGGSGGAGGAGALLDYFSTGYGSLALGNIDLTGGAGGAGGSSGGASFYGGSGGAGGAGGTATVSGQSISFASGGTIRVAGGNGSAGGAAPAGFTGIGGNGGNGGSVNILAVPQTGAYGTIQIGSLNIDGVTIPVGTAAFSSAPLANGGAGAGGGLPGAGGLLSIIGDVVVATVPTFSPFIQGTNQLLLANTAPSTDEIEKKNKENKEKKGAVCK